jgi:hypothetical protein
VAENSEEVLREVGYSNDEIAALIASHAVGVARERHDESPDVA